MKKQCSLALLIVVLFTCNAAALSVVINYVQPDVCNEGKGSISASPIGGTAPYTYQWSNGSTVANLYNVPAGVYTVTVTDGMGTSATANATVVNYPDLTAGNSSWNILSNIGPGQFVGIGCPGACNAQLFIDPMYTYYGTQPYSIQSWSSPGSPSAYQGQDMLGGGCGGQQVTYTITDAVGCLASAGFFSRGNSAGRRASISTR